MSFGDVNRLVAGLIRKGLSSAFNREITFITLLKFEITVFGRFIRYRVFQGKESDFIPSFR